MKILSSGIATRCATAAQEFILVDAVAGSRVRGIRPCETRRRFKQALDREIHAEHLPFEAIDFVNDGHAVRFTIDNKKWQCDLSTYEVTAADNADVKAGAKNELPQQIFPAALATVVDNYFQAPADLEDASDETADEGYASPQAQAQDAQQGGQRGARGQGRRGGGRGGFGRTSQATSPDGKWTAPVRENNIVLRDADGKETEFSKDGRPENGYVGITFSPDSKAVVSFRMEPGDHKEVYRIQSSPAGTGGATSGGVGRAVLQTSTMHCRATSSTATK